MKILSIAEMHSVRRAAGFTLIEMSVVLIIVGLLIGGVLVGQDLIRAAGARATISQIERYHSGVKSFVYKFQGLPGDMDASTATAFGFLARGTYAGQGDGNGLLEGLFPIAAGNNCGGNQGPGETTVFWVDLTNPIAGGLVEGSFTSADFTHGISASGTGIDSYLPAAKIGRGNYIYAYSGGNSLTSTCTASDGKNYFGLSVVSSLGGGYDLYGSQGLTVSEAYKIDEKMDDGMPQSGAVTAMYINWFNYPLGSSNVVMWAGNGTSGGKSSSGFGGGGPSTGSTASSSTTCYDNGNVAGLPMQYSMGVNNGANLNCALSFQFP